MAPITQQADLSVYAGIDPDDIYNKGGNSLTFFYTGTMYVEPYPTNHDDMLRENPEMFYDIFPDLEGIMPEYLIDRFLSLGRRSPSDPRLDTILQKAGMDAHEVRRTAGSRGKALNLGDALLGRVGEFQGDLVMALWQSTDNEYFEDALANSEFLAPIQKRFGNLSEMIVVGIGEEPQFWKSLVGDVTEISPDTQNQSGIDTRKDNLDKTQKKKYNIDGRQYTREELGVLRGKLHSSPRMSSDWSQAQNVLCSSDLLKYPELKDFRPAICSDFGSIPKNTDQWLDKTRDLYTKEKSLGRHPSTGLLYPAWRAQSENRKPLRFRDFLTLENIE